MRERCVRRPHHPRRCAADRALWAASRRVPALSLPGGARSLTGLRQAAGRSNLALIPTRASQVDRPSVASRHAVPAVCFDFLPRLAPVSASARDMVPPHTIAGIIYSLCATSAAAALKPSRIAARSPCTHCVPCARGGSQPHSRTERRFWISAARESSERTSRVLSLPRSRRHIAKSTVAL